MHLKKNNNMFVTRSRGNPNRLSPLSLVKMCTRYVCHLIEFKHQIEDLELPLTLKEKLRNVWHKYFILNSFLDEMITDEEEFLEFNFDERLSKKAYLSLLYYFDTHQITDQPQFWFNNGQADHTLGIVDYYVHKRHIDTRPLRFSWNRRPRTKHRRICVECFYRMKHAKVKDFSSKKMYWQRRTERFLINNDDPFVFTRYIRSALFFCSNCILQTLVTFDSDVSGLPFSSLPWESDSD